MINKTFTLLTTISLLLLAQLRQADDFLDMLNAEAKDPATKNRLDQPNLEKPKQKLSDTQTSNIRIMDKIAAKDNAFIPKNKNEIEYRAYLKDRYRETYLQYIKLDSDMRELVYEQYAKSSFPKIETTQKAIEQFLK